MSPAIRPASAIDVGQTLDAGLWSRYQKWLLAFAAACTARGAQGRS